MSIVHLDRVQWEWLRHYYIEMLTAVEKTQADGRERGFFIVQNGYKTARSRTQVGTESRVILKMKTLPDELLTSNDKLMSFHTHNGSLDSPTVIDKKTAVALGEEYTVIGYFDKGKPHIKVWSISQRWDYRIRRKLVFTF